MSFLLTATDGSGDGTGVSSALPPQIGHMPIVRAAQLAVLCRPAGRFATLRAALWSLSALRNLRGEIAGAGLTVYIPPPPPLAALGQRGVEATLFMTSATCLERSLIMQRWLASHGCCHEVVIGVAGGSGGVQAHAWIDSYDPASEAEEFRELTRVALDD